MIGSSVSEEPILVPMHSADIQCLSNNTRLSFITLVNSDGHYVVVPVQGSITPANVINLQELITGKPCQTKPESLLQLPKEDVAQNLVIPHSAVRTSKLEVTDDNIAKILSVIEENMEAADEESDDADPNEPITLEVLERFAKKFKKKRIQLNYNQGDVGLAMGKLYGYDLSQSTISRFEALNLSFHNMVRIKPLLQRWLDDLNGKTTAQGSSTNAPTLDLDAEAGPSLIANDKSLQHLKKRARRSSLDPSLKKKLEYQYLHTPGPSRRNLRDIAKELHCPYLMVKNWFNNRRSKARAEKNDEKYSMSTAELLNSHFVSDED